MLFNAQQLLSTPKKSSEHLRVRSPEINSSADEADALL
jgi:hypothetical protein